MRLWEGVSQRYNWWLRLKWVWKRTAKHGLVSLDLKIIKTLNYKCKMNCKWGNTWTQAGMLPEGQGVQYPCMQASVNKLFSRYRGNLAPCPLNPSDIPAWTLIWRKHWKKNNSLLQSFVVDICLPFLVKEGWLFVKAIQQRSFVSRRKDFLVKVLRLTMKSSQMELDCFLL